MYKVVGYTWEADTWCEDCFNQGNDERVKDGKEPLDPSNDMDEVGTMFEHHETDYIQHCAGCSNLIESQIISREGMIEGIAHLINAELSSPLVSDFEVTLENCWSLTVYSHHFDKWFDLYREDGYYNKEDESDNVSINHRNYGLFEGKKEDISSIIEELESIFPKDWGIGELWVDLTDLY